MRAVLDPNVLISALLSPGGRPAQIVSHWLAGKFELVVSDQLLAEVISALGYPKLRSRVTAEEAAEFVELLRRSALVADDPADPQQRSPDPGDDYLLALAESERAVLVSGDRHLLGLADRLPVYTAGAFLEALDTAR